MNIDILCVYVHINGNCSVKQGALRAIFDNAKSHTFLTQIHQIYLLNYNRKREDCRSASLEVN